MSTYWQLVIDAARRSPHHVIAEDESDRQLTAVELVDRAEGFAAALHDDGVGPLDIIAWQLPTTIEAIIVIAGLARLGATQNALVPIYRRREVEFAVRQTGAARLFVPPSFRGFDHVTLAREVAAAVPGLAVHVIVRDQLPWRPAGGRDRLPPPPIDHVTARWVFYTSGTEGDPKGVRHSDATLIAAAAGFTERVGFTARDRSGVTFPFSHVGGPIALAGALLTGYTLVLNEFFDPHGTPESFRTREVTVVSGPPIVHQAFVDAQRRRGASRSLPHLRAMLGGGTPKPPGLSEALRDEVGVRLLSGYGATEVPNVTFSAPDDPADALDRAEGRLIRGAVLAVVDQDEREVGPNEIGELRLSGPQRFLGYVDSSLDAGAFDRAGRFRSGDIGYVDNDGNLFVTGRLKEIIIRKGENLSAREIELVLLRHPAIADAAVIGLPDPRTGERACAVVVRSDGSGPLDLMELAAHCRREGLMSQKIPEQLELVAELPRNAMGKVMRAALRKRYDR